MIPIVFAIDSNVVIPCAVTITSLIYNAKDSTVYDVYILYNSSSLHNDSICLLTNAFSDNRKIHLSFVDVGNLYENSYVSQSDHITTATYYRLFIPEFFEDFDKILYSDVDIIFQSDLTELYETSLQNNEFVAAVLDLAIDDKFFFKSELPYKIGKSEKDYFNAGFLVMNLKQIRLECKVDEFKTLSKMKFEQNDQDILNVACKDKVQLLPSLYNFQLNHFSNYMWGRKILDISFCELFKKATLHYSWKHKPWNSLECVAADTWWHYYKMSPVYDDRVYFKRQYDQIESSRNDYHKLSNYRLFIRLLVNFKHKLFQ